MLSKTTEKAHKEINIVVGVHIYIPSEKHIDINE